MAQASTWSQSYRLFDHGLAQVFKRWINSALLFYELFCKECFVVRIDAVVIEAGIKPRYI